MTCLHFDFVFIMSYVTVTVLFLNNVICKTLDSKEDILSSFT